MAYQYDFFSKQLIGSDKISLSDVFPDAQTTARQAMNVAYGLGDIVLYLQDVTQDFKRAERQYIDLDNAIQSIVFKYYKSKSEKNPFAANQDGVVKVDTLPREAVVIRDGKTKGKGKSRNLFKKDEEAIAAPIPTPTASTPEGYAALDQNKEEETLKEMITFNEQLGPDSFDAETISTIADQVMATFGYGKEEEAKKWFKDNGFDYDKYNV